MRNFHYKSYIHHTYIFIKKKSPCLIALEHFFIIRVGFKVDLS